MNRLAAALAALTALLVSACGNDPPPPRPRAAAAPPPVVKTDDDDKPVIPTNIYVYSPIGKRDPFQPYSLAAGGAVEVRGRSKTPLEKWGLEQLKLAMTVTGTSTPMAVVEDPESRGWTVRLGDFIGKNGGKVTGIHRDELVVTETITDHSTGRVYPQEVKLAVPVSDLEKKDTLKLQEGEQLRAMGEK